MYSNLILHVLYYVHTFMYTGIQFHCATISYGTGNALRNPSSSWGQASKGQKIFFLRIFQTYRTYTYDILLKRDGRRLYGIAFG